MAKPTLGVGKKRYSLSLTEKTVDRFKAICRKMGASSNVMSVACDDMLLQLAITFESALEKGTWTTSDMLKLMGQQLELEEVKERNREEAAKRKQSRKELINANANLSKQKRHNVRN